MTEKLIGEALVEKIRQLTNKENDISKSRLAVECGYVRENGLPDFDAFYKAMMIATGNDPNQESDASEMSEEKLERINTEIKADLVHYAEYLLEEQKGPIDQATIKDNSVSWVYASRLNSVLSAIWKIAPEMKMTMRLMEEKDLSFNEAAAIAEQEVEIPELPECRISDNEDGRTNVSWYWFDGGVSCFYTVDAEGIAVCKEYPDEHLDLSDYDYVLGVATTVYCDLTRSSRESDGVNATVYMCKDEPVWKGVNLLPTNHLIIKQRIKKLKRNLADTLGRVQKMLANSLGSRFKLRLRIAKKTGFSALLSNEGLSDLAEHYWDIDQDEKSVETLSMLLKRTPDNTEAIFRRAIRFKMLERYNEATADLTKLIELDIKTAVAYRYRAECKLETKDHSGAEEDARRVLKLRTNNINATGAYEVLRGVEEAIGNDEEAQKIQQKIDELERLPILLDFINEEEKLNYKIHDFDKHWKRYREESYQAIKESSDVPFDLDSLFECSKIICTDEALEDWERESICIRATAELAKFPLMFRESEEEDALRQKLDKPLRHFIVNLRKDWSDHYVSIAVEIIATVKEMLDETDINDRRRTVYQSVSTIQKEIYKSIADECESCILVMDKLVKFAKSKSPFTEEPDPTLIKEDNEDGRLSAIWGNPKANAGTGHSYTYLVDFEGDAYVKEFEGLISFSDEDKAPYIAATIVQDIYGEYDRENAVAMMEAYGLFGESVKEAKEMTDVFNSLNKSAKENRFFKEDNTTDTLKAFLSAIPDKIELEEKLISARNPYDVIQIAEEFGFVGLAPDSLEKAWFGQPIVPKYLFHHFKRKGAYESTTMTLYKAEQDLDRAEKSENEYLKELLNQKIQDLHEFMDDYFEEKNNATMFEKNDD